MKNFDFYAPYRMPGGRFIYGAAAANRRAADAGGWNNVAAELVVAGVRIGYQQAVQQFSNRQGR